MDTNLLQSQPHIPPPPPTPCTDTLGNESIVAVPQGDAMQEEMALTKDETHRGGQEFRGSRTHGATGDMENINPARIP